MKIEIYDKELVFQEVKLKFQDKNLKNIFALKNNKTLIETLEHKKYKKLKEELKKYDKNFQEKLGEFLADLKEEKNKLYLKFLNKYGDQSYCKFYIEDKIKGKLKGIYLYTLEDKVVYIGRCCDNYNKRINMGYGNISPKNCYLDGQQTNCHINFLINLNIEKIRFFIYPLESIEEIKSLEKELIKKYLPEWNIALK